MNYEQYKLDVCKDILETIKEKSCQPILFIGSGFSRRYCGLPSWGELLSQLGDQCKEVAHEFAYYIQSGKSLPEIGSIFAQAYREWAWGEGRNTFPQEYFSPTTPANIFVKHAATEKLAIRVPDEQGSFGSENFDKEIQALKYINPHAIITTNYDQLLEAIFHDYTPVIGQQVIRHSYISIGEIFKIHGCVSEPSSLILTQEDYEKFSNDKKYLSAKLFTLFVEHPLVFIGYSASDQNIKNILQEIHRMLPEGIDLVQNIYITDWKDDLDVSTYPSREKVIDVGDGRSLRIKNICTNSFEWVYKAFKSDAPLEKVNIKLLRSITHRVFDLVRKDVARNAIEVNFQMLSHALEHPDELAQVYGIASINNPSLLNITHPFLPAEATCKLGLKNWQQFNQEISNLFKATGFDMRASDNKYHVHVKPIRRYSQDGIDLLSKFLRKEELPDLSDPTVTGDRSN